MHNTVFLVRASKCSLPKLETLRYCRVFPVACCVSGRMQVSPPQLSGSRARGDVILPAGGEPTWNPAAAAWSVRAACSRASAGAPHAACAWSAFEGGRHGPLCFPESAAGSSGQNLAGPLPERGAPPRARGRAALPRAVFPPSGRTRAMWTHAQPGARSGQCWCAALRPRGHRDHLGRSTHTGDVEAWVSGGNDDFFLPLFMYIDCCELDPTGNGKC